MTRIRTYKTQAVVLKQIPLGEADRIITVCTPNMGLIRAVAKGVRRSKSKLRGHIELLNHISISLTRGRNLDIVSEAESINSFGNLRKNLKRLSIAFYIAEIVHGFSAEESPNIDLYRLLLTALSALEVADQIDLIVRYCEISALSSSGYKPELHSCVDCRSILEPRDHVFSYLKGGILCPNCRDEYGKNLIPVSLYAMKLMRFMQKETLLNSAGLKVSSKLLNEVAHANRMYIRFIMEKELKTTRFMDLVSNTSL